MRLVLPALVVVTLACAPEPGPAGEDVFGEQQGLAACSDDAVAASPDSRCFTWRAVAGVSMGGGTAARLGFRYPELFDVVADMGGPVSDGEFFFGMLETNHLSGFCSLETLEQAVTDGKDLDDPTDASLWCGTHDEWPPRDGQQAMPGHLVNVPGSDCAMFRSDFSTWYRGPKEGRGGGFGRDTLIESIADLTNIYGNILFHNEDSKYAPPGVPEDFIVPPQDKNAVAERCANPVVVEGLINREYNPTGSYNAVTFCDGESEPPAEFVASLRARGLSEDAARDQWKGHYQPGASARVMDFALAIDINGNGKRDFAEPLVYNNRERWRDVGADGLVDAEEPGYDASTNPDPSRDNFDTLTNADGAEGNLRRDEGEPYDDDGLDGMPNTQDFGEGNGTYEIAPNLQRVFDRSPREYWKNMSDAQVARLDIWLDAGIRDFLNTAQNTNALYHELQKRAPSAATYEDFPNLPGIDGQYLYLNADYSREAMGQVAYLRYGDASICPSSDSVLGDGNHVGPDVVNRLFTLFSFLSERMPMQGRNTAIGGEVSDLESPTGSLTDFAFMTSYDSEVLGKQYDYGVMLPPDYFFSGQSYPVLYFFHGQGMDADGMSATGLALFGPMKESGRADRVRDGLTDLQRAIIIWVDGECPPDVCWTGNFYADFEGLPRDDRRYEQALYELMRHVEKEYRVKKPELIPLSELE